MIKYLLLLTVLSGCINVETLKVGECVLVHPTNIGLISISSVTEKIVVGRRLALNNEDGMLYEQEYRALTKEELKGSSFTCDYYPYEDNKK